VGNECLTTDRQLVLHGTSTSPVLAGIQVYKYIKRNRRGREGDMGRDIDIVFRVQGIIVVSVDKAESSSHMDAENAINLGKKKKKCVGRGEQFRLSA
jgi:hypothetical protein